MPPSAPGLAITFLYYRDLGAAEAFYAETLGLPLAIDQGWAKVFRLADGAHVGLVDEARGMFQNEEIGMRAFVFTDPEGYQIEVQTPTREGA